MMKRETDIPTRSEVFGLEDSKGGVTFGRLSPVVAGQTPAHVVDIGMRFDRWIAFGQPARPVRVFKVTAPALPRLPFGDADAFNRPMAVTRRRR